MKIIYSRHARERMAERGITESDVEECLRNYSSCFSSRGKNTYLGDVNGRTLKVFTAVDRDSDTLKFVVSTVWRSEDGC